MRSGRAKGVRRGGVPLLVLVKRVVREGGSDGESDDSDHGWKMGVEVKGRQRGPSVRETLGGDISECERHVVDRRVAGLLRQQGDK